MLITLDNLSLLDLTLDSLPPTLNHLYRSHGHVRFKSAEGKHYQDTVSNNIRSVWNNKPPYTSPVEFRITFLTNDNKRWDIDNRVKALQDYLSLAGVIRDDSQIHILHVERIHSEDKRTHISLLKCSKEALFMNFIERCLYDFNDNINKIHNLSFLLHNLLLSVQAQGYNVHIYNYQNDPVTNVIIRKERIENHIKRIKMKIIPVKNLDDSLSVHELRTHQMKDILHKKYWMHKSIDDILAETGISKSTLKRRNRELLLRAKDFFLDFHREAKDN